ncbi:MAG: PQQ-binding-like beta-propeller repeat protein [Gemmataceae bacterium]|nr:PQQ-binding-like beta-propeller repeat protein [Gemmataceae bacterium]
MLEGFLIVATGWLLDAVGAQAVVADEAVLRAAGVETNSKALLTFFQRRTLTETDRERVQQLIRQLGADSYRLREQAMADLTARGPVVVEALRLAAQSADLEVKRRAERCLLRIQEKDVGNDVTAAAVRILAHRKPATVVETMLAFIPFADGNSVADEVRSLLAALARKNGKAHPSLVAALGEKDGVRRAAAAEAFVRAGVQEPLADVRKLLTDPDVVVRLRVAMAMVRAEDRAAVAVLIDTLPQLPASHAWLAEDLLYRLAEGKNPPTLSMGMDDASRLRCRDAWRAWWNENEKNVDLAQLKQTPRLLGFTLIVLLDLGQVAELGPKKEERWRVDKLVFPLDAQVLPGDRLLVAEYHGARVTERSFKGEILWQHRVPGPLVAQRLANGNTFIATDSQLLEVDRQGKTVYDFSLATGERIMKAMKSPNNEFVCLTDGARIVRLDVAGKELHSFPVNLGTRLFGGRIHVLANGRVLIPHNAENKVVEYDARGKAIWEAAIDQPVAATRLPNGNTLVTTMLPRRGAVEFDPRGQEVWSYHTNTRVTRALRR